MIKITEFKDPLLLALTIAQDEKKVKLLWMMESRKLELKQFRQNLEWHSDLLIEELRQLTELGLVSRVIHLKEKPVRVEYALSNRGALFLKCLRNMKKAGTQLMVDYGLKQQLIDDGYLQEMQKAQ